MKKVIYKIKKLLETYGLDKVVTHLSPLSNEQSYNWVLVLLKINKFHDLNTVDWDTLLENYNDEIRLLTDEIERNRSLKSKYNNTHLMDVKINRRQIKLAVEDYYLYVRQPLLAVFRDDDKHREKLLEIENKPNTYNQLIAHLKSVKRYYENRRVEIEAFQQISTQSNSLITELLREIHSSLPPPRPKSKRARGYQKGTPTKEQTFAEIQMCLADRFFYHDDGTPNVSQIYHQIYRRLNNRFEENQLPGVNKMVELDTIKKRVEAYLQDIYFK